MRIALDYGKTGLEVEIPDANLVGPLGLRGRTAGRAGKGIGSRSGESHRRSAFGRVGTREEIGLHPHL